MKVGVDGGEVVEHMVEGGEGVEEVLKVGDGVGASFIISDLGEPMLKSQDPSDLEASDTRLKRIVHEASKIKASVSFLIKVRASSLFV